MTSLESKIRAKVAAEMDSHVLSVWRRAWAEAWADIATVIDIANAATTASFEHRLVTAAVSAMQSTLATLDANIESLRLWIRSDHV